MNKSLVIVPTYNEKGNIFRLIKAIKKRKFKIDILIIDDNSPDKTGKLINKLTKQENWIHVLCRKEKTGLGSAYVDGFKWGLKKQYTKFLTMDADFSHPIEDIPRLIKICNSNTISIGSRYVKGSKIIGWQWNQYLNSWGANFIARTLLMIRAKDSTAGFKCYPVEFLKAINLDKVYSSGYAFQPEMLLYAQQKSFVLSETPIIFVNRKIGKSKSQGEHFKFVKNIFTLALKQKAIRKFIDFAAVSIFFLIALFFQTQSIGKLVYTASDEGVYLYASKLITQGYLPYKDFFLGHLPFLMYVNAFILVLTKFNLNIFHWIYIIWVLSILFPVYFITKKITKNSFVAFLAIFLLITFNEFSKWGIHFFAIRQASMPFLAWGIYFLTNKKNLQLSAIFLAFFSLCLMTNLILACGLILSYLFCEFIFKGKQLEIKKLIWPTVIFIGIIIIQLAWVLLLPNGYKDVFSFQMTRFYVDLPMRLSIILATMRLNWPIIVFGLIGTFVLRKDTIFLSIFNFFAVLIVIFVGNSFFIDYLCILGVNLAISTGILFSALMKLSRFILFPIILLVVGSIYFSNYNFLKFNWIDNKNPRFFAAVDKIKNMPEPILAYEPLYALYADKNLTFYYNVADARYFFIENNGLSNDQSLKLLVASQTIIIDDHLNQILSQNDKEYISQNFKEVYFDGQITIYVKNNL